VIKYEDRIVRDPQVCGGDPVFKGTRVTLRTVLASLAAGDSPERILADFPSLKAEDVQAAISFAATSAGEDLPVASTPDIAQPSRWGLSSTRISILACFDTDSSWARGSYRRRRESDRKQRQRTLGSRTTRIAIPDNSRSGLFRHAKVRCGNPLWNSAGSLTFAGTGRADS